MPAIAQMHTTLQGPGRLPPETAQSQGQQEIQEIKENGLVTDRSSFRLASALVFGGELLYIAAGVFHPGRVPANQHPEVFAEYANSAYWGAVHMMPRLGYSTPAATGMATTL